MHDGKLKVEPSEDIIEPGDGGKCIV